MRFREEEERGRKAYKREIRGGEEDITKEEEPKEPKIGHILFLKYRMTYLLLYIH